MTRFSALLDGTAAFSAVTAGHAAGEIALYNEIGPYGTAATMFRDNDPDASVRAAVRLWWTSRLRGRRFASLVRQAREITQERIFSLGVVERGEAGQREAMSYFFAVLHDLVKQHRHGNG